MESSQDDSTNPKSPPSTPTQPSADPKIPAGALSTPRKFLSAANRGSLARKNETGREKRSSGGKTGTNCHWFYEYEHVGLGVHDRKVCRTGRSKLGLKPLMQLYCMPLTSTELQGDLIVKTGLVSLIWLLSTLDSTGFLDSRHDSPCAIYIYI